MNVTLTVATHGLANKLENDTLSPREIVLLILLCATVGSEPGLAQSPSTTAFQTAAAGQVLAGFHSSPGTQTSDDALQLAKIDARRADANIMACPPEAITRHADPAKTEILWKSVRSNEQAIGCMHALATSLGHIGMKDWLIQRGFRASFLKTHSMKSDILLSSNWSIKRNGLLYKAGVESISIWMLAESQTFSFRWNAGGSVSVRYKYNFK